MFATVFFGVLDPATGTLTYVNAGHDAPLLLAPGGGPPRRLAPTGPTVGLLPDLEFGTGVASLAPGDLLLAFTDGVTDARAPDGALYGEERLVARAVEHAGAPGAAAVLEAIEADLDAHGAGAVPFDDVTLLALRRCG
jgi:sigma-B regulation protein RsbU (phosphoserine phosphatase)